MKKGLAVTALITGGVAFVIGWIPILGTAAGIIAIVFGIAGLKQSKPMSITGIILGALAFITSIAIGIAAILIPATEPETSPATEAAKPEAQESEIQKPEKPDLEIPEPEEDLAELAEAAFLQGMGTDSLLALAFEEGSDPNNPIYYISGWETVNSSTLRVHVQLDITKDEAKQVGIHVFNFIGKQFPDLKFIAVRDIKGVDVNVNRSDSPLADR
jgi:hypothetical protein